MELLCCTIPRGALFAHSPRSAVGYPLQSLTQICANR